MKSKMTFESAVSRLEEIVTSLQDPTVSLEESLKLYEEGAKLSKYCYETLEKAEQKVRTLTGEEKTNEA
ncbi:MAG: exodeoxyribonuclease VII small subunit [Oscillospiraceae bacterium]|jgi:exodeoxyribonuclease VII small subunit|nr:exodeoxyribonuclease VII small subunit [Oscillospiraceae bacterium]MCI2192116.1 exodeoxyribonuclease VII small subunit [Oscillospiraceae bacterium]